MGFVCLPAALFLYWLVLRPKREEPFPRNGFLRLWAAGAVSVAAAVVATVPLSLIFMVLRIGTAADVPGLSEALRDNPAVFQEMITEAAKSLRPSFLWNLADMFVSAALLEEGLKFLTCRIAIRKEGMIRTWMDAVTAFAIVGISFELIENIAFGVSSDLLTAALRSLAAGHFVFGVIMGYFYGKYLVGGRKKDLLLSFALPVLYHTLANTFVKSMKMNGVLRVLGYASSISFIAAAAVSVILILYWQKHKTLDIPVLKKQDPASEMEEN